MGGKLLVLQCPLFCPIVESEIVSCAINSNQCQNRKQSSDNLFTLKENCLLCRLMLILIPFDTDSALYHLMAYYYMYTFLKSPTIFGVDVKLLVGSEDQKYI